jgi:phage gp36-like protein
MAEALAVTLHAMGEETASGQSAAVDIGERRTAAGLALEVLAGTSPALNITVQTSASESGPWRDSGTFPTHNGPGRTEQSFAKLLQYVRISWTQTANVTFSVAGEAHVLYATTDQIESTADVLSGVSDSEKARACITASCEAEAYLSSAYTLPLTGWPSEMSRQVGLIAAWHIIQRRGIRADGADELVLTARDRATAWFNQVKMGRMRPPGIADATPTRSEVGPRVRNRNISSRGW